MGNVIKLQQKPKELQQDLSPALFRPNHQSEDVLTHTECRLRPSASAVCVIISWRLWRGAHEKKKNPSSGAGGPFFGGLFFISFLSFLKMFFTPYSTMLYVVSSTRLEFLCLFLLLHEGWWEWRSEGITLRDFPGRKTLLRPRAAWPSSLGLMRSLLKVSLFKGAASKRGYFWSQSIKHIG